MIRYSLIALASMTTSALANPVDDYKASTALWLRTATVVREGSRTETDATLRKAAGSLDFTLRAADLGFPSTQALQLRGAIMTGSQLLFTVDQRYSPALALGNGVTLSRITAQLNGQASWLPGVVASTKGNVRLALHSSSYVVVQGNFGTQTIALVNTELVGGIVQPALASITPPVLVCSDTHDKLVPLTVQLGGPARGRFAPVELTSIGGALRLPHVVGVKAGVRTAIALGMIKANFVGRARVVASAGGVSKALDVVVRRRQDCAVSP